MFVVLVMFIIITILPVSNFIMIFLISTTTCLILLFNFVIFQNIIVYVLSNQSHMYLFHKSETSRLLRTGSSIAYYKILVELLTCSQ